MKTMSSRWPSVVALAGSACAAGLSHAQCEFTRVSLRNATSTWTQQCDGRWSPASILDNNPGTAWAIGNCYISGDRTRTEVIVTETIPTPILAEASRIRVRIHSGGYYACCGGGNTTIGAFRILVTGDSVDSFADSRAINGAVDADWITVDPSAMSATPADPWGAVVAGAAPTLSVLGDGVILASGANPVCAWYTLEADLPIWNITGVRLELIDLNGDSLAPAEGLPTGGPGRHNNGNALIRQFIVESAQAGVAITQQPQTQSACRNAEVAFTVAASNPEASFQWRHNGVNIPGAVAATLTLKDLQDSDEGSYDCVVTTSCGAAVSEAAGLNICRPEFNCDGFLDFFDYADFVLAFERGEPRADYNDDGFIDMFDYMWYVEDFELGC